MSMAPATPPHSGRTYHAGVGIHAEDGVKHRRGKQYHGGTSDGTKSVSGYIPSGMKRYTR